MFITSFKEQLVVQMIDEFAMQGRPNPTNFRESHYLEKYKMQLKRGPSHATHTFPPNMEEN